MPATIESWKWANQREFTCDLFEDFVGVSEMPKPSYKKNDSSHLEVRDTINWVDRTDNRDFASQPSFLVLEHEKDKKKYQALDKAVYL